MITVSIIGGSGYAGGELLRILLAHPKVQIMQVTSTKFSGESVALHHPNLRGRINLQYCRMEELKPCDLLFVSLPNGISSSHMGKFVKKAEKIIDLAADFRLKSAESWKRWYKADHKEPKLLGRFIYGIPEARREEIKKASWVAGPGCEAIVSILCLWPIVKHGIIDLEKIIIDAKMSSSQAGRRATASSHHPERKGVVRSYMPTKHRHTAEIEQELSMKGRKPVACVSATAIEMVRGLLVTIHTFLEKNLEDKDIWEIYRLEYGKEPFIRIVKQKSGLYRYPEPKILQGTNFCDIGFEVDRQRNRLVVIGAIDNLVKGTAGNAVQCMNLMFGFDETLGLNFSSLHPI